MSVCILSQNVSNTSQSNGVHSKAGILALIHSGVILAFLCKAVNFIFLSCTVLYTNIGAMFPCTVVGSAVTAFYLGPLCFRFFFQSVNCYSCIFCLWLKLLQNIKVRIGSSQSLFKASYNFNTQSDDLYCSSFVSFLVLLTMKKVSKSTQGMSNHSLPQAPKEREMRNKW